MIDEAVAFTGGMDPCFGQWDTAQPILIDDVELDEPDRAEQIWVGECNLSSGA